MARIALRNSWFALAYDEARAGHFDDAVHAFAMMLTFESDTSLAAGETDMLARCRALDTRLHSGSIDEGEASASFFHNCSAGGGKPH